MNMKSLLKELVKDPQIKALYNQGFDRSIIHKLILEALSKEEILSLLPNGLDTTKEDSKKTYRKLAKQYHPDRNKDNPEAKENFTELSQIYAFLHADINERERLLQDESFKSLLQRAEEESNDDKESLKAMKHLNSEKSLKMTRAEWKELYMYAVRNSGDYLKNNGLTAKRLEKYYDEIVKGWENSDEEMRKNFSFFRDFGKRYISSLGWFNEDQKIQLIAFWWNMMKNTEGQQNDSKQKSLGNNPADGVTSNIENANTEEQVKSAAKEAVDQVKADDSKTNEQKKEAVKDIYQLAQEKLKELAGAEESEEITLEKVKEYIETKEWKKIEGYFNNIKKWFDSNPEITRIYLEDYKQAAKDNLFESDYSTQNFGLFSEIIESIKQFFADEIYYVRNGFLEFYEDLQNLKQQARDLTALVVRDKSKEPKANAAIQRTVQNTKQTAQKLLSAPKEDEKAEEKPTEEPGQPIPSSGTVSPKVYAELYDKILEKAFDDFEDDFLRTPFLSKQSEVLTQLVSAVSDFNNKLSEATKQSFSRTADEDAEELQEQEETEQGIELDRKDQKLIMVEHKVMQKYLKMLVKMVTSIDQKKINTVGFEQDSRKIRAIAKQLLESIIDLMKIIDSAQKEGRKGLEFKEGIIKEEETTDDKKPRTQLTRDQIIDLMEQSYDLIVDYGTNIEKYSRTEKEAVELKPVEDAIEKLNQVFAKMLPYFPEHSPFGKTANLKEIKKQVRGISRDIIQVMKQAKGLVEKPENFDEQAIKTFAAVLLSTVSKLQKYFDLEIDDAKIKAMLPKVPPAKSASYGKDSDVIFSKIQEIIKKYGPSIEKTLKDESVKSWEKVGNFLKSKLRTYFDNKIPAIIAGEVRGVKPEYIKRMEVITKFIKFVAKMKNEGILNENLRSFFKQLGVEKGNKEFGKQFGKQFTRDEIREIKDYLSKEQNYQDLLGVIKQALRQPSDSWLFDDFQLEPEDEFKPEPKDDFELEPEDEIKPEPDDDIDKDATQPATDGESTPFEEFQNKNRDEQQVLLSKGLGKVNSVKSLAKAIYKVVFGKEYKKSFLQRIKSFFTEQEEKLSVLEKFEKMDKELGERDYNFLFNDIYDNLVEIVIDNIDKNSSLESIEKNIEKFITTVKARSYKKQPKIRKLDNDKFIEHLSYYFENYPEYRSLNKQKEAEVEKFSDKDDDKDLGDSDLSTAYTSDDKEDLNRLADQQEFVDKYEDRYRAIIELMDDKEKWREIKPKKVGKSKRTYLERFMSMQKAFEDILDSSFGSDVEESTIKKFDKTITKLENDLRNDGYLGKEPQSEPEELEPEIETAVEDAVKEKGIENTEEIDEETKEEIVSKAVSEPELKDKAEETGVSEEDLFDLVTKELDNLINKNKESGEFDLKDAKELLDTEIARILLDNKELNKIIKDFGPAPTKDQSAEEKDKLAEKYTEDVHNKLLKIFKIVKENKRKTQELKTLSRRLDDFRFYLSKKKYSEMILSERYETIRDLMYAHGIVKDLNQAYKQGDEEKVQDKIKDLDKILDNKSKDPQVDEKPPEPEDKKPTKTDDSAAKKDTYSEAMKKGFKPSTITIIQCPECNTKFRYALPEKRLKKPKKPIKMRCLVCASQFSVPPINLDYQFEKKGEDSIFVKGKDIFESTGSLEVLTGTKKEQIERKLEKIIEHYLNTGKL